MIFLNILMIIGIVLASLIIILLILMSIKTKLVLQYDKTFILSVRYLLNFKVFPIKEKKKKIKDKKMKAVKIKEQKDENVNDNIKNKDTKPEDKSSEKQDKTPDIDMKVKPGKVEEFLNNFLSNLTFWDYIEIMGIIFNKFIKKIYCEKFKIEAVIASEDAAKTAMDYGNLNTAVYTMSGALYNSGRVKELYINITPDFTKKSCSFKGSVIISIRLIHAILSFIDIYKYLNK